MMGVSVWSDMSRHGSRDLIAILQETLDQFEQSGESDRPALTELKRKLVRTVAELELAKDERSLLKNEEGDSST